MIEAQPEPLAPIEITSQNALVAESTRSVLWPVVTSTPSPVLLLPQTDDALNSLNGLQTRTQGSPTFSIRGSAQSGRALVLYDHIPLNFASGLGPPRIFLPKETVAEVRIVKGPASLFYGSQALAGAVDFVSKKYARPEINISISDTNESFLPWREGGLAHQSLQVSAPLYSNDKTHLQVSMFQEFDDGAFPYQTATASGVRDPNSQKLRRIVLNGSHQLENAVFEWNGIIGQEELTSPGSLLFPLATDQKNAGRLVSVSSHWFLSEQHSLKSRVSHMDADADFLEQGRKSYNDQTSTLLQNEWIVDWGQRNKFQFFADAFFHKLDNSFAGAGLEQNNYELGSFLSLSSGTNLKHQLGGRFLVAQQVFLPTVATHYFFSQYDSWVSYSEGFRNPTLTDLFSNSPFFVGNPNLTPETSQQYELGLKTKASHSPWQWDLRLFHMEYGNFIESFERSPNVFSRVNQGAGYSRGLDWESRWEQPHYDLRLSYNFLDTQSRREQRAFRLSPRHQITWSATLKRKVWNFQIQNTHWYNVIDLNQNQVAPLEDWQQWNFLAHIFVNKKLRMGIGLINAFNENKELTLNYPEPQRKYWLQIHQEF